MTATPATADAALDNPRVAERAANIQRLTVPTILLAAITAVGTFAPGTWRFIAISVAVQGLIALAAGMLFGRVGLLSLCPLTFAGLSCYVVAWLTVHHRLPFFLMVALGTLAAIPAGLLVGGLAVRLRGVNLAVVSIAFAAAVVSIFSRYPFPGSQDAVRRSVRPLGFTSDRMYFLLSMAVLVVVGLALEWYGRRRGGQAWRAVRSSERATAAAGLYVPTVKLKAFVVSSAIAGIGGAMLAGQYKGTVGAAAFVPVASLAIVAAAVLVGSQSLSGAVFAGLLGSVVPEAFRRLHWSTQYPQILFGIGAIQALSQGGGGIAATFPWRRPRPSTQTPPPAPAPIGLANVVADTRPAHAVLEVQDFTVRYGALAALSQVNLTVPPRTVVGVIGPNGAGKTTLIDAVCGFSHGYVGTVLLDGAGIDRLGATQRARAGLRRTFQQGRAIPELTVGQYINLAVDAPLDATELRDLLGFFHLPPNDQPIGFIDVGTRRVIEVAAAIASKPRVAFLDEPAAGLGESQTAALSEQIIEIPRRYGCSVVLIEHDVDLVARVCQSITVLDFGLVIASGPPADVLADRNVAAAYLGDDVAVEAVVAHDAAIAKGAS